MSQDTTSESGEESDSLTGRIDYERITENVDVGELVEGTQWEDEVDEDAPLGQTIGLIGAAVGRLIGERPGVRSANS